MKQFVFIFFIVFSLGYSQNKELLYDFTDLPQAQLLNPGSDLFYKSHMGIPLFSQIHFNYGIRGLTPYNLLSNKIVDINTTLKDVINNLNNNDHLAINQQLELLSFGWNSRRNYGRYYSLGVYEEFDFIGYFPKDIAMVALYGNQYSINQEQGLYNISAKADLLNVYHFGVNQKINNKLTIGARVKLYASMLNFETVNNTGGLTTTHTPDGNNIYRQNIDKLDLSFKTSGYSSLRDNPGLNTIGSALLLGNIGYGMDFGFTYTYDEQWTYTGSIVDFGLIRHRKDTEIYRFALDYRYDGIETPSPLGSDGQNIISDVLEKTTLYTLRYKYTTFRPTKINGSIKYSFNELDYSTCNCTIEPGKRRYTDALGLQLFTEFRPRQPIFAGSLFYYKRISNKLITKFTYTLDEYSYDNFGFLTAFYFGKFNLYLAMDNVFDYRNLAKSNGTSVQFGINIIR